MDILDVGAANALAKKLVEEAVTEEQITAAVDAWLEDHPEATTTVEDGAISYAKLDSSLKGSIDDVGDLKTAVDNLAPITIGKNKYDAAHSNPQDLYVYDSTTGKPKAGNNYAITGLIPVQAETQYTFSTTSFAQQYCRVYFYSGPSGDTYISRGDAGLVTFTTPANCTFVGFYLFGRSHTTAEFNAAIAAAQLELGSIPTAYEAYSAKRMVSPENIIDGENINMVSDITNMESLVNLYDKRLAEDGKYINKGSISSNANWAWTGKIPVKPNTQYNISRDPTSPLEIVTSVQEWAQDGTYIQSSTFGGYSYLMPVITSANTYFISVNMTLASHTTQDFNDTIDTIMLCYGTQRPLTYVGYNVEGVLLADKLSNSYFNPDVFTGKKWLACGTSITWYDSKAYSDGLNTGAICRGYVGNVARRKALLVTNEGISGSTLALTTSETALINRYQNLDWGNADIATIEYGVNDFGNAVAIGTAEDAAGTDTFAACLKTVIEYALAQNPKLCLVICTEPDVRGNTANSGGHYLYEYTDVTLAIAKQYRLPVCDWFYHSGINSVTKGSSSVDYLTADGTHPNDAGHLRMGAMLNQVFDSLIC